MPNIEEHIAGLNENIRLLAENIRYCFAQESRERFFSAAGQLTLAISAQHKRILTLQAIKAGEPITKAQHDQLLMMPILARDPAIRDYPNVIHEAAPAVS